MAWLWALPSVVAWRRPLTAFALGLGLGVAGCLWVLLPPAPRASWPAQGNGLFLSAQGNGLFLSPDGRLLATVAITWQHLELPPDLFHGPPPDPEKCQIHVYDVASGRETAVLTWGGVEVRSLAFSADCRHLAALSVWTGEVREWEVATGRELGRFRLRDLPENMGVAAQVAYSSAGDLLALMRQESGGHVLWDCRRRKVVAPLASKDDLTGDGLTVPGFLLAFADPDTLKV